MDTKSHAVTDAESRPLRLFMTTGQFSGYLGAVALLGSLPSAEWLFADRGHDADLFREALNHKGINLCVLLGWKLSGKRIKHARRRCKGRNWIETLFGCPKDLAEGRRSPRQVPEGHAPAV